MKRKHRTFSVKERQQQSRISKAWWKDHPEVIPFGGKHKERTVCKILKKHARELKNDPERLSTAFIQNLIGSKCKIKK